MERLRDWLRRIDEAPPGSLYYNECRALVPGFVGLEITEPTVCTEPAGFVVERPGDGHPIHMLRVRFADTLPLSIETAALAWELASILGLASGAAIEIPLELPVSIPPDPRMHFFGFADALDRRLANPPDVACGNKFRALLQQIRRLSADDARTIGAAARLHYSSCTLAGRDARAAYVLLVAGIETLSGAYGAKAGGWNAVEEGQRHRWEKMFKKIELTDDQATRMREELGNTPHLKLKVTFSEYGATNLPGTFWDEEWVETTYSRVLPSGGWHGPIENTRTIEAVLPRDRELLSRALGRTYDFRSKIVHRGVEAGLQEIGLREGIALTGNEPLPYPILRATLLNLIRHELVRRSTA